MAFLEGAYARAKPLLDAVVSAVQAGGFVLWFHDYVGIESMVISGPSMLPTFNDPRLAGDIVLLERVSSWFPDWISTARGFPQPMKDFVLSRTKKLEKGDVVVACSPMEANKLVCKRLVAVEGEVVDVPRGSDLPLQGKRIVVPKGHVWLEGDCPEVSRDSREYGPVPLAMIYGRAWLQVWPFGSTGWISTERPKPRR
ncbi:hypothetical protein BSKO_08210 [Bryopsis sp. KO-2023]|nr:hypothetical protein BSKO_08210 [Bryopsis sp. KO-2023]